MWICEEAADGLSRCPWTNLTYINSCCWWCGGMKNEILFLIPINHDYNVTNYLSIDADQARPFMTAVHHLLKATSRRTFN